MKLSKFEKGGATADIAIFLLNEPLFWAVPLSIDSRPLKCGESLSGLGYGATGNQPESTSFIDSLLSIFWDKSPSQLQMATVTVLADCGKSLRNRRTGRYQWSSGMTSNEDLIITSTPGVTMCDVSEV